MSQWMMGWWGMSQWMMGLMGYESMDDGVGGV